jgi:UDP-glucose 6-dehydrogenase
MADRTTEVVHAYGDDGRGEAVVVVGLGEIGQPLADILDRLGGVVRRDIAPTTFDGTVGVMHIAIPFNEQGDFVRTVTGYVHEYRPHLTIVHSTVLPGTTRRLVEEAGCAVVYSPVRGKHSKMTEDLLTYKKWLASPRSQWTKEAAAHLDRAGFRTATSTNLEALELAKLLETTYLAVLIGWAQEVDRYADAVGADYAEVLQLVQGVPFLPQQMYSPGFIGGHCLIPNATMLSKVRPSAILNAVLASNEQKREEWIAAGRSLSERVVPRQFPGDER